MHSSKGLEYKVVIIIGANEGISPYQKAFLQEDMEEERRLFYVAMTRAKDILHIFAVRERFGRAIDISRFIFETGYMDQEVDKYKAHKNLYKYENSQTSKHGLKNKHTHEYMSEKTLASKKIFNRKAFSSK